MRTIQNIKTGLSALILGISMVGCNLKLETYYNEPRAKGYDINIFDYDDYVRLIITDLDNKGPSEGSLNAIFPLDTNNTSYELNLYNSHKGNPLETLTIDSIKNIYYSLKKKNN